MKARVQQLQQWLRANNFGGMVVPMNDPHFSEYVSDHWKCLPWLTGFTGSAGTVAVTQSAAALWVDSRYFLQADQQLAGTGIETMKMLMPGTPTLEQWLVDNTPPDAGIAVDGKLFPVAAIDKMAATLDGREVVSVDDPFTALWINRPPLPTGRAFVFDEKYAGESASSKIDRLRKKVNIDENQVFVMPMLDDVAWLYNIRGNDIRYNPLVVCYAAVSHNQAWLFAGEGKFSPEDVARLEKERIVVEPYSQFGNFLRALKGKTVVCNPAKFDLYHYGLLEHAGISIGHDVPQGTVTAMKSVKNPVEIDGFRKAMLQDGVALARFWMWLEDTLEDGKTTSEWEVSQKITECRAARQGYMGDSFGSIVGYNDNGAVIHYGVTPESSRTVDNSGVLLFDSGGQYITGTTDITRTIGLGKRHTAEQKRDYTAVLQGMIDLSRAVFPENTRGCLLDILARGPMYRIGARYLHGTGHGVGHFLNVHEGPQSVRMEENPVVLEKGMVMSNEPGIYRDGRYGIRTENMMAVVEAPVESEYGTFLQFETLTLFPIDTSLVDCSMLSDEQAQWLNDYHARVYDALSPHLGKDECKWLKKKTSAI